MVQADDVQGVASLVMFGYYDPAANQGMNLTITLDASFVEIGKLFVLILILILIFDFDIDF